ncbi:hypothetical protein QBC35DRAFT_507863 [Podospora australis]|uniref:Uncharacterized protein n=1 Tax=Podospora australis TaxID=1536484 RepID=A0AAN7AEF1_9PEZI|nr:hypothetical protein QBC35DRAFT_507863 [Podospora australis]
MGSWAARATRAKLTEKPFPGARYSALSLLRGSEEADRRWLDIADDIPVHLAPIGNKRLEATRLTGVKFFGITACDGQHLLTIAVAPTRLSSFFAGICISTTYRALPSRNFNCANSIPTTNPEPTNHSIPPSVTNTAALPTPKVTMSKAYRVGDESPLLKRVLIPFWVLRVIISLVLIGVYALLIAGLGVYKDDARRLVDEYNTKLNYEAIVATSVVIMVIMLICLILDLVCIIKRARRTLSPPFFFGTNLFQTTFWVVSFIISMIGARPSAVYVVVNVVILLSYLGLMIYASIVFHWYRTGKLTSGSATKGVYVATANPTEAHNLVANDANTAYAPQSTGYGQTHPQEYPKPAYYDQSATQPYSAQGYEPYSGQPQQQPAQGYEMHTRTNV